jgi:hypothetical protein
MQIPCQDRSIPITFRSILWFLFSSLIVLWVLEHLFAIRYFRNVYFLLLFLFAINCFHQGNDKKGVLDIFKLAFV